MQEKIPTLPSVTIITVVFNDVESLGSTIASVLSQTYKNIEYVIIDGGSTDGTCELIRKFDKQIDYWVSESDAGIYDAMNKGIKASSGDYLLFLNSGDSLANNLVVEQFVSYTVGHGQVDLAYGDALEADAHGSCWLKKARAHDYVWYGMFAHHQAMFFSKKVLSTGYDLRYRIGSDYALVAAICNQSERDLVKLPFVVCVFQQGGLSQTEVAAGRADVWEVQREILGLSLWRCCGIRLLHFGSASLRRILPKMYNTLRFLRAKVS